MSYEGLDDEEELKTVPVINQNKNNNCNIFNNSESERDDKENLF